MDSILFLIVGGVIGWLASLAMRTDAQQGIILNVIVGIAGSAAAGWLIAPAIGIPSMTQGGGFDLGTLGVSLAGAILLLAIYNLVFRGRLR